MAHELFVATPDDGRSVGHPLAPVDPDARPVRRRLVPDGRGALANLVQVRGNEARIPTTRGEPTDVDLEETAIEIRRLRVAGEQFLVRPACLVDVTALKRLSQPDPPEVLRVVERERSLVRVDGCAPAVGFRKGLTEAEVPDRAAAVQRDSRAVRLRRLLPALLPLERPPTLRERPRLLVTASDRCSHGSSKARPAPGDATPSRRLSSLAQSHVGGRTLPGCEHGRDWVLLVAPDPPVVRKLLSAEELPCAVHTSEANDVLDRWSA